MYRVRQVSEYEGKEMRLYDNILLLFTLTSVYEAIKISTV
jgi:hypothetical protein